MRLSTNLQQFRTRDLRVVLISENCTCDRCGVLQDENKQVKVPNFTTDDNETVMLVTSDNENICDDCADNYTACVDCGDIVEKDDAYYYNGDTICESCYNDYYFTCEECGEIVHEDDSIYIEDKDMWVCRECAEDTYYYCEECGKWYSYEGGCTDNNDKFICYDCSDRYGLAICEECGEWTDSPCYSENDDAYYCPNCYEDKNNNGEEHDYYYKPSPIFQHTGKIDTSKQLYFGVELEVESSNYEKITDQNTVSNYLEWCYMKHDGSLSNTGFEIVSHPMTMDFINDKKDVYDDCFYDLRNNGCTSHDNGDCGLHVHVNRDYLGMSDEEQETTIVKILYLFEKYWDKIVTFSRRTSSQLSSWANRNTDTNGDTEEIRKEIKCYDKQGGYRYRAINLANENTIEFRVFRGTLKLNTFYATIQFVSNVVNLAKDSNIEQLQDLTFRDILKANNYEELKEYAKERGLL